VKTVYLCGPINGCTDAECNDWRGYAKENLWRTLDPMKRDYRGREAESYREIVDLDKLDVRTCDVVLANCPKPSVGTSMEILLAWQAGKPVVVVAQEPLSPWLRYHSTKVCGSIAEACAWINAL
jgi:nucleoside 2-deoxyribosyltransferase